MSDKVSNYWLIADPCADAASLLSTIVEEIHTRTEVALEEIAEVFGVGILPAFSVPQIPEKVYLPFNLNR